MDEINPDIILDDAGSGDPQPEGEKTPSNQEEQLKTLQAQKEHFREKSQKLAQEIEELNKKLPKEEPPKESPSIDPIGLTKYVKAFEGYSEDEIDFVQTYAKGKELDPLEALQKDEVKSFIEAKREKVAKEEKIPPPSSAFGGTDKSWQDLKEIATDTEKHKKFEEEVLKKKGQRGI